MIAHKLTQEELQARRDLAFKANHEIAKLAEGAARLCTDDDAPIFHGMMARIMMLTEIIYYAQQMNEEHDPGEPNLAMMQRSFSGLLA